jgi:putative transcriptional regulator
MSVNLLENQNFQPSHHPPEELLMGHAAGSLPAALSAGIAAHLTLCPHCRAEVRDYEALAGALVVEAGEAAAMPFAEPSGGPDAPDHAAPVTSSLPWPLARLRGLESDSLPWKRLLPGVEEHVLESGPGRRVSLYRVAPGASVPRHTHEGEEFTLVLEGGYTDSFGAFTRGDVEFADDSIDHRPVAMAGKPCICFVVTDGSLRFRGLAGILLNWLSP